MTSLVLDASAALAMPLMEPEAAAVRNAAGVRGVRVLVPWVFWLEVVNGLTRRHGWRADRVLRAVYDLEQVGVQEIAPDRVLLLSVIDLVERHGLTAYDASYLAVAISADAQLLTGDRRLAQAAGDRAIYVGIDSRSSEAPAEYGRSTWAAWPGAAAYLQELRAEVLAQARRPGR
ncbi:MAG: type II toxin-antitoxin system VapC family toxin [Chloroflexi bacterium]|nr:type II toxin-antitoxin system VapC family toxin [Chloroflexota bacterium]